jgi:hypothetical protein
MATTEHSKPAAPAAPALEFQVCYRTLDDDGLDGVVGRSETMLLSGGACSRVELVYDRATMLVFAGEPGSVGALLKGALRQAVTRRRGTPQLAVVAVHEPELGRDDGGTLRVDLVGLAGARRGMLHPSGVPARVLRTLTRSWEVPWSWVDRDRLDVAWGRPSATPPRV